MALLYGVSPIDLIPDILPLLGWVDDALIVPLLLVVGIVQLQRNRRSAVKAVATTRKF
jgi:uncharacterized membrane protein YkvA (DUF1232 family)